ncbi:MAG: SH3 domain-containing protein, partial [Clostridia bacterium]
MSTNKNAQIFRIFTIILAVIMFSAAFTVLSLQRDGYAYGTGETGQITASSLYVRSGPGTNYSKIGSLKKGKTFTVAGTGKDRSGVTWYKLRYGSK